MKDARSSIIAKFSGAPRERSINAQIAAPGFPALEFCSYRPCRCDVAKSSPETSKSGFVAVMAERIDFNGASPRYTKVCLTTGVLVMGWPGGQTACTAQPALARATARRAVGNHREVVTIRTAGFNFRPFDEFPSRTMRQSQHLRYGEIS